MYIFLLKHLIEGSVSFKGCQLLIQDSNYPRKSYPVTHYIYPISTQGTECHAL